MTALKRHIGKWSGWYWYLSAIPAWLWLLAVIFREGWIK
nr:MAG TPA: hypothetical protein [Caudoviricetes sp.]